MGNDTTQQTQRTFARANLLWNCYGETGVMDFGLYRTKNVFNLNHVFDDAWSGERLSITDGKDDW